MSRVYSKLSNPLACHQLASISVIVHMSRLHFPASQVYVSNALNTTIQPVHFRKTKFVSLVTHLGDILIDLQFDSLSSAKRNKRKSCD